MDQQLLALLVEHGLLGLYDAVDHCGITLVSLFVLGEDSLSLRLRDPRTKQVWHFSGRQAEHDAWDTLEGYAIVYGLTEGFPKRIWYGSTDIDWFDGADGTMCLECAIRHYFGGSVKRFEEVNDGRSYEDAFGRSLDIHWQGRHPSYSETFQEGIYCVKCDDELEEPEEDGEQEDGE